LFVCICKALPKALAIVTANQCLFSVHQSQGARRLPHLQILGGWSDAGFSDAGVRISAHCNRVPVTDGHTECVSIKVCM
jgi:hypothetical protein